MRPLWVTITMFTLPLGSHLPTVFTLTTQQMAAITKYKPTLSIHYSSNTRKIVRNCTIHVYNQLEEYSVGWKM